MIDLPPFVESELTCLQHIGYHEARDQGYHGMVAVMLVAKNRVLDPRFPDTYCEVMLQPKQFSFVDLVETKTMYEEDVRRKAYEAAYSVYYSGRYRYLDNALYYHADYVRPNWNYDKLERITQLGDHIFYADNPAYLP